MRTVGASDAPVLQATRRLFSPSNRSRRQRPFEIQNRLSRCRRRNRTPWEKARRYAARRSGPPTRHTSRAIALDKTSRISHPPRRSGFLESAATQHSSESSCAIRNRRWLNNCIRFRHEKNSSDTHNLGIAPRPRFGGPGAGFLRHSHWRTASAARIPRAAPTRPRLCVGRGLLVSAGIALHVARRLLDAAAV